MTLHASKPLCKRLRVAMFATRTDFGTAPHGIPCGIGPLYCRLNTHLILQSGKQVANSEPEPQEPSSVNQPLATRELTRLMPGLSLLRIGIRAIGQTRIQKRVEFSEGTLASIGAANLGRLHSFLLQGLLVFDMKLVINYAAYGNSGCSART